MPELPEVETVARQLHALARGWQLKKVDIFDVKIPLPERRRLANTKLTKVFRMGKQVILQFKSTGGADRFAAVHLRMTGRLVAEKKAKAKKPEKHLRARFHFDKGLVDFIDPRRFGTIVYADSSGAFTPKGHEPLDATFTVDLLRDLIGNSPQAAKTWLLRQDKIVGIGNIYASEILYRSKISPLRAISDLSQKELHALHRSIQWILNKAIENCGTTFSDFQDAHGVTGSYQEFLKVYEREGQKCRRCTGEILRIVQQQRSTYYCAECQV